MTDFNWKMARLLNDPDTMPGVKAGDVGGFFDADRNFVPAYGPTAGDVFDRGLTEAQKRRDARRVATLDLSSITQRATAPRPNAFELAKKGEQGWRLDADGIPVQDEPSKLEIAAGAIKDAVGYVGSAYAYSRKHDRIQQLYTSRRITEDQYREALAKLDAEKAPQGPPKEAVQAPMSPQAKQLDALGQGGAERPVPYMGMSGKHRGQLEEQRAIAGAARGEAMERADEGAFWAGQAAEQQGYMEGALAKKTEIQEVAREGLQQRYQASISEAKDHFQALQKEAEQAHNIDPGRMFRGEGGGLRLVGTAIAAALGSYASAITKTPNYALRVIEKAVDRDIMAQREAAAGARWKAGQARTTYQMVMQRYDSDHSRMLATQSIEYNRAANQLRMKIQGFKDQGMAQKGLAHEQRLRERGAQAEEGLIMREAQLDQDARMKQEALRAKKEEGGARQLKESAALVLADLRAAQQGLQLLQGEFNKQEWHAFMSQYAPGSKAKAYAAQREIAVAVVRKSLSGAAFTEKENQAYLNMIPDNWTTAASGKNAFRVLEPLFGDKIAQYTALLRGSNFHVPGDPSTQAQQGMPEYVRQ